MTRLQFWILNAMGGLIAILLICHIFVVQKAQASQTKLVRAQQFVREGQVYDTRVRQLAQRIYQVAQQNQDQALKDLLTRQDFHVTTAPAADSTAAPDAPATAPTPTPTH